MLEKSGAIVVMTRIDDKDVSITERWKFNREQKTDLFLSVHHNANAQNDKTMNRTESFYHWKDRGGPSEDAARLVHREMQALLKLPNSKAYMCWAYGVLRENSYPAILVEPSYLANPEEEQRLRDEKYLSSLVEAYFRGIEAFFEGGRPEVDIPETIEIHKDGIVTAKIKTPEGTALLDPQRMLVEFNGKIWRDFSYDYDKGELKIRLPAIIKKGKHTLSVSARNLAGHASFVQRRELQIPYDMEIMQSPETSFPFQGILKGKKIVVDPEGGGDYPVAIGKKGLRASDANLVTGIYLHDYLDRAGADVSITRMIDKSMDNVSRVRFGLERNPDVFVSVGHRLPEPGMGEKPNMNVSRAGARWSGGRNIGKKMCFHLRQLLGTGKELGDVSSRDPLPTEDHNWSSWEAMHAAQEYTALYVCPLMFDGPGVEERISTTAGCRKEALAIFYGLLDYFGLDDTNMACVEGVVMEKENQQPLPDALVWIDNTLLTQTESDGKFLLKFLEQGEHTLRIVCKDYKPVSRNIRLPDKQKTSVTIELE